MSPQPTVIDLFCGAGGFSLGFKAAGCHLQAAADIDEEAGQSYKANFSRLQPAYPPDVYFGDDGDLETLDFDRLVQSGSPDILIGGPPCQGFSRIGRAKLDDLSEEGYAGDPRNELYRRFLDIAQLWKPSLVVMENVPGILSVHGRNLGEETEADLARRGYLVGYAVLNAVWYGVPQYRERFFLVGIRADIGAWPVMPAATHRAVLPAGYLQPLTGLQLRFPFVTHSQLPVDLGSTRFEATTVADAVSDLLPIRDHLSAESARARGNFRHPLNYRWAPHSEYSRLMREWPGLRASGSVTDHVIRQTPRDYETFRRMRPGDRYPEALAIARARLEEELLRLGETGRAPAPDSSAYREVVRRFVPPYPDDIFVDKWRKLIPDQPSWTVPAHLAKDTYSHIHPDSDQARPISVREAARLQSFPDAFGFIGNMGDCFRQIGNAVPPLLAWALAATLLEALKFPACRTPWIDQMT